MLVGDWMSPEVLAVEAETSMMKAGKLMKEKGIRRLPVVDKNNKLIGIVSDRDIKEASPSKATTLDVHELYYLLSEVKVKDIMTPSPLKIRRDETVEKAAVIMREKKVGGLPVVDEEDRVVGMLTETDVFKVLISITGVDMGGVQLGLKLPNTEGSLKTVLDDLRKFSARIISILSAYDRTETGTREVYIRIQDMDKSLENQLLETLKSKYTLLYWVRDTVRKTSL